GRECLLPWRHEVDEGRSVAVAGELTVYAEFQFGDLNRTAAAIEVVAVVRRDRAGATRMGEVKQVGAIAAHDDAGMAAVDAVVGAAARGVEQVAALCLPVQQIVGAVNPETFPKVDQHPPGSEPLENVGTFPGTFPDALGLA